MSQQEDADTPLIDAPQRSLRSLSRNLRSLLETRATTGDVTFVWAGEEGQERAHRCAADRS